jgi:hypothetical protein
MSPARPGPAQRVGWSSPFGGLPTVLRNTSIQTGDGGSGVRHYHFGFNMSGTQSIPIVLEACTNLASPVWLPLQTFAHKRFVLFQ